MKKIISLILALSVFLSLIPLTGLAKEYVVYQDFEGFELGESEVSTSTLTVGGQEGASFEIVNPPRSLNKALYVANDAKYSTKSITANTYLVINSSGKLTVEFKIYPVDYTQTTVGISSRVNGNKTFLIMKDGAIKPYSGDPASSLSEFARPYDAKEWHKVKLVLDIDNELYDFYFNDKLVVSDLALPGRKGHFKEYGVYRCLIQRSVTKGNYGEAYFDDMSVLSGEDSDEITPAVMKEEGEEGLYLRWRPVDKFVTYDNPPLFTWPVIPMAKEYTIQLSQKEDMSEIKYEYKSDSSFYAPQHTLDKGVWYWRVNGTNMNGTTEWSEIKRFRIAENAAESIIPDADTMAANISVAHPRLWFNNETLKEYRDAVSKGDAKVAYEELKKTVDATLSVVDAKDPNEDFYYPENATSGEKTVIKNKLKTYALEKTTNMYQSAFVYMIEDDIKYAEKAIKLLEAISEWDQSGFSGYKTHDQVHRDVAHKCSIVYDWLYNLLTDAQREKVVKMIKERVETMYVPLMLQHPLDELPYDSHGTTASKMIFTICFALMHDVPEASDWFENIQPFYYKVQGWGGEDGGHANGTGYANGSLKAEDTARHDLVYTSTGYKSWGGEAEVGETPNKYLMFFMSNGAPVGSFGDDETIPPIRETVSLTRYIVGAVRYNDSANKWASETRGTKPYIKEPMLLKYFNNDVESIPPFDMMNTYHDRDIGWIAMKSDIIDPWHTALHFKSSFWGSYNHSHADNNGFMLYAYGEPLAVSSGYFDYYYSDHDKNYSHQTLAHNAITHDGGKGQTVGNTNPEGSINSKGKITGYLHGDKFNLASGNAERAYPDLDKADRYLIYLKPDYVIVIDELSANDDTPTQFEFNLKGFSKYEVDKEEQTAVMTQGRAKLYATFQYPKAADIEEFDTFIGIDGLEHRPSAEKLPKRKDHYGVRFDTDKVSDAVMVTTLDVLKNDENNKDVTVNKNDECMEIIVEGNKKVYVRLDYNKEKVSFGNVSFKGTAAVFEDDSFMLVNGTELIKDGVTLISADVPTDISYETGEIHIYGNEDGKAEVNLSFKVNDIKNEKGFEIASFNSDKYDYDTMPYKWTQNEDNTINIDFEAGIHNMYLNGTPVMKYDGLTVRINGRVAEYENPAFSENGTVYVPLLETTKMYNAEVTQDGDKYTILKSRESYGDYTMNNRKDRSMTVYANSTDALYNGEAVTLSKPTVLKNGVLYIPLRAYYEVFTNRIGWSDYASTAWVYTEPVYCDDMSSTQSPRTDIMTDEEYAEYQKKRGEI